MRRRALIGSEKGIALVISLVLSAVALAISATTLYMVTQRITLSGVEKRYHSALAAAKAGVEITKEYIEQIKLGETPAYPGCAIDNQNCLSNKLANATSDWNNNCVNQGTIECNLGNYRVTMTIEDTIRGTTQAKSTKVVGVVHKSQVTTPAIYPYIYRVLIQAQRIDNAQENARITMLYAY